MQTHRTIDASIAWITADEIESLAMLITIPGGGEQEWVTVENYRILPADVTEEHPVVVLDPRELGPIWVDWPLYFRNLRRGVTADDPWRQEILRQLEAAFESLPKPSPKPPEPQGLGAVVLDRNNRRWIRHSAGGCSEPWMLAGHPIPEPTGYRSYTDVDAIEVRAYGESFDG